MQTASRSHRTHIGIFGRCNVGKSSLFNALAGQSKAVVSSQPGTTTDPVYQTMELLPLGPVVLIDTPGLDDTTFVGEQRVKKTREILSKTDLALVVLEEVQTPEETQLLLQLEQENIPYLLVESKKDIKSAPPPKERYFVSAQTGEGIYELKEQLAALRPQRRQTSLLEGLVEEGQRVVLVTPIDASAPKGRMILPQQETMRECLDRGVCPLLTQPAQLPLLLDSLKEPPHLVITDSQVFGQVDKMLPPSLPLTSFSILFARKNGLLEQAVEGIKALDVLTEGDRVLVAEGCTHHRQCDDIGTQKIPKWLKEYTGVSLFFSFVSGGEFPIDISPYQLILHCGGCMLGGKEIGFRQKQAQAKQIPMTNYGTLISRIQGTLERSLAPLGYV